MVELLAFDIEVKRFGNSAHLILPKEMVGERVDVVRRGLAPHFSLEFRSKGAEPAQTLTAIISNEIDFAFDPGSAVRQAQAGKVRLLDWLREIPRKVLDLPTYAYPDVSEILTRYADLNPDFTDAAMVWFAEDTGCRAILTVDVRDFSAFRLAKGRRFDLVKWFER